LQCGQQFAYLHWEVSMNSLWSAGAALAGC
jgi:hypothetical protein